MLAIAVMWTIGTARADPPQLGPDLTLQSSRIDLLEQTLQSVIDENVRLSEEVQTLKEQSFFQLSEHSDGTDWNVSSAGVQADSLQLTQDGYFATYDNGMAICPRRLGKSPYSLKINHQNTFRYTGFVRDEPSWVDSAGNTNPIFDSTNFGIPRGRLIFSGNALMPELSYLLNIDYNTVNNNPIGFRAYALSYRFSRALQGHVGQNKVPGTREWLHSSFDAQAGPDRSMATTFFRPSLSQGIWFTGEPVDGLKYHAMLSNGFNTVNLKSRELNDRYCVSESAWWEPWGDFGRGYTDIEAHRAPAVRLGSSFTYSIEQGSQDSDYMENSAVRLSDGTAHHSAWGTCSRSDFASIPSVARSYRSCL